IPKDARGPITFTARMNYRKFSWYNTRFSFAGVRDPAVKDPAVSPDFDDGPFVFTGDTSSVSGAIKAIPDLPTVVIAEDRLTLPILAQALKLSPDLASAHYFMALSLKARGRYDDALAHLGAAAGRFPRDKVVRNQMGRILFLQRRHPEAIAEFEKTLRVDPEDL